MRITFKAFDSKMASREKLFKAALDFANKIKREDLITITHTEDRDNIVVSIWYWTDEPDKKDIHKALVSKTLGDRADAAVVEGGELVRIGRAAQEQIHRDDPKTLREMPPLDEAAPHEGPK